MREAANYTHATSEVKSVFQIGDHHEKMNEGAINTCHTFEVEDFTESVRYNHQQKMYDFGIYTFNLREAENSIHEAVHSPEQKATKVPIHTQENPTSERRGSKVRHASPIQDTNLMLRSSILEDQSVDHRGAETSAFKLMMKGNSSVGSMLHDTVIQDEIEKIAFTITGSALHEKMQKAGSPIFPPLMSALQTTVRQFREKACEVTLKLLQQETSKWVYSFMKDKNQKIAAHPKHIKEIPSDWFLAHGSLYPSKEQYVELEGETGLQNKQVRQLFQNSRKRAYKTVVGIRPDLKPYLKAHFSPEITGKLRKWQEDNRGKQPDQESLQELMKKTNCSNRQIVDWFNNHKPGRNRSKKRAPSDQSQG